MRVTGSGLLEEGLCFLLGFEVGAILVIPASTRAAYSPIPWRDGIGFGPQAGATLPGNRFQSFEQGVSWRILPVPPGHAGSDQLVVQHVSVRQNDQTYRATIAVCVEHLNRNGLSECQAGGRLSRTGSKGLTALRRVDAVEPDTHFPSVSKDADGITIVDSNDTTSEGLGRSYLRATQAV
ncbi:MAG: hypothetical protein KatS3mg051_1590 [Anaerolineae bacterium]|nr:MAG: hypothetical protein KatS3mg051_1590 [Anaerolineae bacterium]